MSGRMVEFVGGPMDGLAGHRDFSTGGEDSRTYYMNDRYHLVHWYTTEHHSDAPFIYQGIRERHPGEHTWNIPQLTQPTEI